MAAALFLCLCVGQSSAPSLIVMLTCRSTSLGVTVNPVRVARIQDFGSLDVVGERLLEAERKKVSWLGTVTPACLRQLSSGCKHEPCCFSCCWTDVRFWCTNCVAELWLHTTALLLHGQAATPTSTPSRDILFETAIAVGYSCASAIACTQLLTAGEHAQRGHDYLLSERHDGHIRYVMMVLATPCFMFPLLHCLCGTKHGSACRVMMGDHNQRKQMIPHMVVRHTCCLCSAMHPHVYFLGTHLTCALTCAHMFGCHCPAGALLYDYEYELDSTRGRKRILNTVTIYDSKLFVSTSHLYDNCRV
jgi:hypothetical protein